MNSMVVYWLIAIYKWKQKKKVIIAPIITAKKYVVTMKYANFVSISKSIYLYEAVKIAEIGLYEEVTIMIQQNEIWASMFKKYLQLKNPIQLATHGQW